MKRQLGVSKNLAPALPSSARAESGSNDGVIREVELLTDAQVILLSDRRTIAPYGLVGGTLGQVGAVELTAVGRTEALRGKFSMAAKAGD